MSKTLSHSQPWNHQSAYAALQAKAKHVAGLENARALIRQSRQIRYLRYVKLAHQRTTEVRTEDERIEPVEAENPVLEQAA